MDENKTYNKYIVQLASFAMQGKKADSYITVRRLINTLHDNSSELYKKLTEVVKEYNTKQLLMRDGSTASIPVDLDSRLELVRVEYPPVLDIEPIWSNQLKKLFDQILAERKQEFALLKEGLLPTRSILLTGPPGVGKTLAAKWLAKKLELPLLTLDLSAIMSSFLGRTGNNIRHVLDYAKSIRCVLLLDEVDALAKKRDDAVELGELKRLVTVILQEIENWPANGLLIAATNHPQLLDPAIWRRFDTHIDFSLPKDSEIHNAIILYLKNEKMIRSPWINVLTILLRNSSFSDIERTLINIRRESIITGRSLESGISEYVSQKTKDLSRNDRVELAQRLVKTDLSQRRIHDITGISRDTIRRFGS